MDSTKMNSNSETEETVEISYTQITGWLDAELYATENQLIHILKDYEKSEDIQHRITASKIGEALKLKCDILRGLQLIVCSYVNDHREDECENPN